MIRVRPLAPRSPICASAAVVALALLAAGGLGAPQAPVRIVAIGDIHGDFAAFSGILGAAGLVDQSGSWTGGSAVLVQTGDYTDRGPDVRRVLDLLRRLDASASKAGGRVHVLLGNHEVMNLLGNVRDVNPVAYAAFADADSEKRRTRAFDRYVAVGDARARALGARPPVYDQRDRGVWMQSHPLGYIEYLAALQPDGEYGGWLRERQTVFEAGGNVFMHAGIDPATAPPKLDDINRLVADEIRKFDAARKYLVDRELILPSFSFDEILAAAQAEAQALTSRKVAAPDTRHVEMLNVVLGIGKSPLLTGDGPLWFRGFATWSDEEGLPLISGLLKRYGVKRFVTGHSIRRDARIAGRFSQQAFLIDTAMSSVYKGRASALEIAGERISAIYTDAKVVLSDSAPVR